MKAEEILCTIDHIRGMVQELTQSDGTVGMIDTKFPIALEYGHFSFTLASTHVHNLKKTLESYIFYFTSTKSIIHHNLK